ncbi:MAG TPA: TIGR03546 family protein [Pirellulaceae bacterium]|jgi:uncharacterized protein (TIGR03546 family)|nr:TIGR03546 family protein [Pirellulaceae bacterium]
MSSWLCYPVRSLAAPFWEDAGAHYAGLGAALGAVVGIVPKDNLTALLLATLLLTLRVNLATAGASALLFAWIGWLFDGQLDLLGAAVLEHERTYPLWNAFFALPWAGWTRLDNTIVAGSFCAGVAFACPVYVAARLIHRWSAEPIDRALRSRAWIRQALGPDFIARGATAPGGGE